MSDRGGSIAPSGSWRVVDHLAPAAPGVHDSFDSREAIESLEARDATDAIDARDATGTDARTIPESTGATSQPE